VFGLLQGVGKVVDFHRDLVHLEEGIVVVGCSEISTQLDFGRDAFLVQLHVRFVNEIGKYVYV